MFCTLLYDSPGKKDIALRSNPHLPLQSPTLRYISQNIRPDHLQVQEGRFSKADPTPETKGPYSSISINLASSPSRFLSNPLRKTNASSAIASLQALFPKTLSTFPSLSGTSN